jgi:pre-mRNA-processing factor 6
MICLTYTGAFAGGAYDEDDKEADEIWEAVDKYMDERRRVGWGRWF